ncbi:MAG: ester cyclase [Solirubrobacterales bacterium]
MSSVEVVEAAYAAVRAREMDRLLALFGADCRFEDVPTGELASGRESLRSYMDAQWESVPDFHVERSRLLGDGEHVAAELVLAGTHAGEFLGVPGSGQSIRWRAAAFYRVSERTSEITAETYYYDLQTLQDQLRADS